MTWEEYRGYVVAQTIKQYPIKIQGLGITWIQAYAHFDRNEAYYRAQYKHREVS